MIHMLNLCLSKSHSSFKFGSEVILNCYTQVLFLYLINILVDHLDTLYPFITCSLTSKPMTAFSKLDISV